MPSSGAPSMRVKALSTPLSSHTAMHMGTPISFAFASHARIALSSGLSHEARSFEVLVDKIIGERTIPWKSLAAVPAPLPLFAAATVSGAGKVQLILDVARLAQLLQ